MSGHIEFAHFKTNVLLKNIIGKDLINNDNIAILELVKNSFDAKSTNVSIKFLNLLLNDDEKQVGKSCTPSCIIIKDNGIGMDMYDIQNKWLNIAYSEKKALKGKNNISFAGAKGVGRFSCDRLGTILDLYTKKLNGDIIRVHIDWEKFEIDDAISKTIQDIDIECEYVSKSEFHKLFHFDMVQGTILKITKLRSKWLERHEKQQQQYRSEKLLSLRQYLEKLVSPNKKFNKEEVAINLDVPELYEYDKLQEPLNRISGSIENKIFEQLDFATKSIESEISSDGSDIKTTLTDKGRKIFEILERNVDYKNLKNIKIVIYYLNTYAKAFFTRKTGIRSHDFGSIFLFIDGFRVNPLGDLGNDWLRLEQRKGQGYARYLGNREIIGRIEVNDLNHKIKIVSSREGIVADETTAELVDLGSEKYEGFYYKTHRRLEKFVVDGLDWDRVHNPSSVEKSVLENGAGVNPNKFILSSHEKDIKIINAAMPIICQDLKPENIVSLYVNDELLSQLTEERAHLGQEKLRDLIQEYNIELVDFEEHEQLIQELDKKQKNIEELEKKVEIEEQKNLYLLATKGGTPQSVRDLIHHIKLMTKEISGHVTSLISAIDQDKLKKNDVKQKLNKIKIQAEKTLKISEMLTVAGFRIQAEKHNFNLPQFIREYLQSPKALTSASRNLDIRVEGGYVGFWVYSSIFEITLIIDNLLSNSVKAEANQVLVKLINTEENKCCIEFSDNGNGLDENFLTNPEEIFALGVTTTAGGSGIGLYSVRELLSKVKTATATIAFAGNGSLLKGACFRITFERSN